MARIAAEGTRERILDAAGGLFYAQGVRAVGMDQIIETAGCGKKLVYSHFASKNDLVAAYLAAERDTREQQARHAMDAAGDDPAEQILALTGYIADCLVESGFRGCAMRNYVAEFPSGEGEPTRISQEYLENAHRRLGRLVRKTAAARPGEVTERIWLIHDGLYAMAARPWVRSKPAVAVALVRDILTAAPQRSHQN
jgi:AcrR family transcriptional regulator